MKFFCWFGLHNWRRNAVDDIRIREGRWVQFHVCERCGKVDVAIGI